MTQLKIQLSLAPQEEAIILLGEEISNEKEEAVAFD